MKDNFYIVKKKHIILDNIKVVSSVWKVNNKMKIVISMQNRGFPVLVLAISA